MAENTFWKNDFAEGEIQVTCSCCEEKVSSLLNVCPHCDYPLHGSPGDKAIAKNEYGQKLKKKTRFYRFLTYPIMALYALSGVAAIVTGLMGNANFVGMFFLASLCGIATWWVHSRPFWSTLISLAVVTIVYYSTNPRNALTMQLIAIPFFLAFAGGLWISLLNPKK